MTTTQMNIAIAEFMGWIRHEDKDYDAVEMELLKYHIKWEFLIPAWFKCQAIIRQNPQYRNYDRLFYGAMRRESIEECHKVVYDFVVEVKSKEETKTI